MTFDDWIQSLAGEEKSSLTALCREAASGDVDRGAVSRGLQALLRQTLSKENLSLTGRFLGAFWQKYGQQKKQSKEEEPFDYKRLGEILPYPLGYRWRSFLWDLEKFERGHGSSNFAFLIAALNGLATRFLAILCVSEYIERLYACDAKINRMLVDKLRVPADGTWKQLIDVLTADFGKDERTPLISRIRRAIRDKYPFSQARKGLTPSIAMQDLVQFRNELLHSTRRLGKEDLIVAVERLQILFRALACLEHDSLVAVGEGGVWRCDGEQVVWEGGDEQRWQQKMKLRDVCRKAGMLSEQSMVDVQEKPGDLYWMTASLEEPALRCWPMMHLHHWEGRTGGHDVFFFNGWDDQQAEYISYHDAQPRDHNELGIAWQRFLQYWRNIPVSPLPLDAKLDFLGIADFYRSHFVGREKAMQAVFQFAEQPAQTYGVIRGFPGMGKTALLAVMYYRWRSRRKWPKHILPLWHFCSQADGWDHPVVFLRSMLAQIDEMLDRKKPDYPTHLEVLVRTFLQYWRELEGALSAEQRVVLFVDGLDEAVDSIAGLPSIPSLLPKPEQLPANASVVVSFRVNESLENRRVEALLPILPQQLYPIPECSPLRGLSRGDVVTIFADAWQEQRELPGKTLQAVWQTATQGENGTRDEADPFILRFLAEAAQDKTIDLERPETVPRSLDELFERFWNRLPTEHNFFVHRLLGMLSMMPDLGNDRMFAEIFQQRLDPIWPGEPLTPVGVAERRLTINKLLVFRGDSYRLFHKRFRAYVQHRFNQRDQALALHLPLYLYCLSSLSHSKHRTYGLQYIVYHLSMLAKHRGLTLAEREEYRELLWQLLWDDDYVQQKFQRWERTDLISQDFAYAFEGFRPPAEEQPQGGRPTYQRNAVVWKQLARSFHLAKRAHFVLGRLAQEYQQQLYHYAQQGDAEQVIRRILTGATPYRRLWLATLAYHWMQQAGHDLQPLRPVLLDLKETPLSQEESGFLHKVLGELWEGREKGKEGESGRG